MVMKPEPFLEAVESLGAPGPVLLMSARGRPFRHADAVRLSLESRFTILCGHYKDVDQRVVDLLGADEVSLGDFVLSGGEPAALAMVDAVVRLLPGALGDHESASSDSHYDGLLSPPSTPGRRSIGALRCRCAMSGNHAAIDAWRRAEAERLTREEGTGSLAGARVRVGRMVSDRLSTDRLTD
jgi:tRNA (guanine37-N1)-methyltransferase